MLRLAQSTCIWLDNLKPRGEDSEKESFEDWWKRNKSSLGHLHPQIAEQWPYRHWDHTSYRFIDLAELTWTKEIWPTQKIIDEVFIWGWTLDPDHDYESFNRFGETQTSKPMNATGTWDYPIIILKTPDGVHDGQEEKPEVRYLLIEGHSRFRYLNALLHRKGAAEEHAVFVIESPT